jgi:hypothetical protein
MRFASKKGDTDTVEFLRPSCDDVRQNAEG